MIRLSNVKVRLQYRWRVRQRLMVEAPLASSRRACPTNSITRGLTRRPRCRGYRGPGPQADQCATALASAESSGRTHRIGGPPPSVRQAVRSESPRSCGSGASTTSGWRWGQSSASFAIWACHGSGGRASGCLGK